MVSFVKKKEFSWNELPIGGIPPLSSLEYKTGSWRTFKPILDENKCTKCFMCWLYCPDDSIKIEWEASSQKPKRFYVDYEYCKGCGICAKVCPVNAISMEIER